MENVIRSRNPQSSLGTLLNRLYSKGKLEGKLLTFQEPLTFRWERPRERLVFWPGFRRNPAQELLQALQSLRQAEPAIADAAKSVVEGARHFLFSTPQLVVQANIRDGKFDMSTVVADRNPFTGAFGQLALQLTILQELMANEARKPIGTFSIQHMEIEVQADVVQSLLKASLDTSLADPYEEGKVKVRKIDGPLDMAMVVDEGPAAVGYKSKFVRQVILPMIAISKQEDPDEAAKSLKSIKASDWRQSMTDWIETVKIMRSHSSEAPSQ